MDKVQQAYWDEYVAPQRDAFYNEIEPHVRALHPHTLPLHESPEYLEELTTLLEKHLKIFKVLSAKLTELSDARLTVKIAVEATRPE